MKRPEGVPQASVMGNKPDDLGMVVVALLNDSGAYWSIGAPKGLKLIEETLARIKEYKPEI